MDDFAHPLTRLPDEPDIEAERIRLLYRQAVPTQIAGLAVGAVLLAVLWADAARTTLLAWYGALTLVTLLRLGVALTFKPNRAFDARRREMFFVCATLCGGLAWGAAGILPGLTPTVLHKALVILTLAGISASAIASTGASLRAHLALLLPTMIPLAISEASTGQPTGLAIAALTVVFVGVVAVAARGYHRALLESLRIRRENLLLDGEIRLAASVFDASLQGIVITDGDDRILKSNPAVTEMTGRSAAEAQGMLLSQWLSERHDAAFRDAMASALRAQGKWEGETWYQRTSGESFPVWQTVTTVSDAQGQVTQRIVIFVDISERKRAEEQIRRIAFQDELTGLPNRRVFEDRVAHAIERAKRHGVRFGVLFIDLSHFRMINDSLGYNTGDQLLCAVAQRLQEQLRREDTVARIEGDKFGLIVEAITSARDAETVAQKVIAAVKTPLMISDEMINPGCCIGIGVCPQDGQDLGTLMENVDTALNQATKQSENCYRFYSTNMSREATERLSMEWALRRAIENNSLVLHYQPKYSMMRGRAIGAEALVRWNHADRGLLGPGEFIPLAEETKLIMPLSRWVLMRALRDWQELMKGVAEPMQISVNVSAQQFSQQDFVAMVAEALRTSGIPPDQLELEITESVLVRDAESAFNVLQALRELGVRVSIDDFGTGYSSLNYLATLSIDTVKIDRAFIHDLNSSTANQALVKAVLQMCQALELEVVAEGVETEAEALMLAQLGGDIFQGYLFSRPIPLEAFWEKLSSTRLTL